MQNRYAAFAALLAVVGVSIIFGMILGGRLNAPRVAFAAPDASHSRPMELAPASTAPISTNFADIVEQALPAVVGVKSTRVEREEESSGEEHPYLSDPFFDRFFRRDGRERREPQRQRQQPRVGEGSGFIISSDGYVLTNNHVVEDADEIEVQLENGETYTANLVGKDPSIDLALLKIDSDGVDLPTLPLGDSDRVRLGEWVIAIGNPLEFDLTVTLGIVSGKERRVPIGNTDYAVVSFLQTDAAINFGNSGGPLLDARGNVIGINTAIRRADFAEGIGFALPINHARAVVEQLRQRGYVRRGFIGITMNDNGIDETARQYYGLPDRYGVIIAAVQPEGPAARAGVKAGDIIRNVDGQKIEDNYDLVRVISSHQPGDAVDIEVFRGGKTLDLRATLDDRKEGLEAQMGIGPNDSEDPAPRRSETREATGFGLTVESLDSRARTQLGLSSRQRGVVVTDVDFSSEAAEKGVRPGMVVTNINDKVVSGIDEWNSLIERLRPGVAVKIDLLQLQPERDPIRRYVFLKAPE